MGKYASGKHALAISDRSGMAFPYSEMVREWNGSLVHYSEFEAKQPQLEPKPPVVTAAGPGGANPDDIKNLQQFLTIPTFDNVSDLNNTSGFTIALGKIDSSGTVTGATTSDPLTSPINYFYITSTSSATSGGVSGGGSNCSAGPVTLEVVNG
jgi:hypothetical protein